MDLSQLPMTLSLAFGLGMLHSLDADHIMTISNLAAGRPDRKTSLIFSLRWALGHGFTLMLIGLLVFLFGLSLPTWIAQYAELGVALILVLIGVYVLFDILRRQIHIHFHQHDDLPVHAHWHTHASHASHQHTHTATFVGMLHGLAGSAPLLALLPLAVRQQPVLGFIYLLIFSAGVLLAMLIFGGLLGVFSQQLQRYSDGLFRTMRLLLGIGAIGVGTTFFVRVLA